MKQIQKIGRVTVLLALLVLLVLALTGASWIDIKPFCLGGHASLFLGPAIAIAVLKSRA